MNSDNSLESSSTSELLEEESSRSCSCDSSSCISSSYAPSSESIDGDFETQEDSESSESETGSEESNSSATEDVPYDEWCEKDKKNGTTEWKPSR